MGGRADAWASFRLHLIGRAVTCVAILAIIGLVGLTVQDVTDTWPIVLLMVVTLGLTVPYAYLGRAFPEGLRTLSLFVILIEMILLGVGVYLLGGSNAVYGMPLYGILVVMAASLHSGWAAYGTALFGALTYGLLVFSMDAGWAPAAAGPAVLARPDAWVVTSTLVNLFFGLAVAVVASSLWSVKEQALARSEAAEQRLSDLNRDLEDRVESATHALRHANRSLLDRNRALASTLDQVNLFAGAVSHDLRNPVTAACEALRLASEGGPGASSSELVALARENLARVDEMVVGLRNVMRVVGTRAKSEAIPLQPLLEEVVAELEAERVGRALPVVVVGELGSIDADRGQLRQVFRNLIANAVDHNRGDAQLRVEVGRDPEAEVPSFFVRDNGRGIDRATQRRIFEPFHRGSDAPDGGLGLGLALAAAVVARAGGELTVESEVSRGATFRFTLPGRPPEAGEG